VSQYVQALRGFWIAFYSSAAGTLYDFEADKPIL
jgi:hypothetical protein